ncbi:MAG TPA: PEP-CTERM sorting domain-containing protein [Pirellulales bacterium]|jgi:glucose/arabinose dehydrogenase|nr:PEP-CTERM sorting domain-containing protein [Pirellulales bacterium]
MPELMRSHRAWVWGLCWAGAFLFAATASAVDYKIERVAAGLDQPNAVTQAPGDPSNIIYYTERSANTVQGFNEVNQMGMLMRYDTTLAGTSGYVGTPVIDLSGRNIFNDDGLEGVAFNPDYNNSGTPGFGKIYVSSSQYTGNGALHSSGGSSNGVPINRVEEYTTTNPANPTTANTTFTKTILQYNNNGMNNHTIDGIGFDPTATGEDRYDLYISTGNGSFTNPYNGGVNGTAASPTAVTGMPSQNPADVKGKILRVDVNSTLADAYPTDPNKNFAIPASNPVLAFNAAHPSTPLQGSNTASSPIGTPNTPALPEVWVTGLRNGYRFTFDRATGNMYIGDVGESAVEEVDFIKAGSNTGTGASAVNSHGPVDFGWPEKEGTSNSTTVSGAPHGATNPFTGATSLQPIQQFAHTGGNAVIGGYVYQGPVASLQGQYFFSDFVTGTIRMLNVSGGAGNFDPTSDPSTFNGANGTITNETSLWNSLLFDPNNPSAINGLGHVVSFGEDNQGNLFIVDFGGNAGDTGFGNATGEYPAANLGAIFEIVPVPEPAGITLLTIGGLLLLRRRRRPIF